MHYLHANDQKLRQLRNLDAPILVVWGEKFFADFDNASMRATDQRKVVEEAVNKSKSVKKTVLVVKGCSETVGTQNGTTLAHAIKKLLKGGGSEGGGGEGEGGGVDASGGEGDGGKTEL